MTKMEEETVYQELLIRRDVLKLVFDLRCYRQLMSSCDSGDFRVRDYLSYMDNFSHWTNRLANLFERAQSIGANPNLLDEYQDDLVKRVRKLEESYSLEEQEQWRKISREMSSMLFVCKGAKTLCGELMTIYPIMRNRGNEDLVRQLELFILYLTKTYGKYDSCSYEYFFLMDSPSYGEWFDECFKAYFINDAIPVEEQQKNLRYLMGKIMTKDEWALGKISAVSDYYANLGIVIEKDDFINLMEGRIDKTFKRTVLLEIKEHLELMPFTETEYLDLLFDDLVNDRDRVPHSAVSPFSGRKISIEKWNEKSLTSALKFMIIPITCISTVSMDELFKLLANKIALLPNNLKVASDIGDYLKTLTPDYSDIFEDASLEANERLTRERANFVLTLKAIANKQETKSTQG